MLCMNLDWYLDGSVAIVRGLGRIVAIITEILFDRVDSQVFIDGLIRKGVTSEGPWR